jgi:hypothetical protein
MSPSILVLYGSYRPDRMSKEYAAEEAPTHIPA